MPTTDTIIVGAGSGTRLGEDMPKAFVDLCGKPILYYSLKTFLEHPAVNRAILVVSSDMIDYAKDIINEYTNFSDRVTITAGGNERWESVRNGCLSSTADAVLIHDAARPLVTIQVIDFVLDKATTFDCVITATPVVDTIRTIEDNDRCGATIDRTKLLRVGTPQFFRRKTLIDSFNQIKNMAAVPTDEAALFEYLEMKVGFAWGDPLNFKITTKSDLEIARALLEKGRISD